MPADLHALNIKDEYLARVLAGEEFLVEDGGMGTMLQARGLTAHGELPDLLNMTHAADIIDIHRAYVEAGAQLITTNTFGANSLKLADLASVDEVYAAAADNARAAGARYVAADVGPIGALLEPLGTVTFDEAYNMFAEQVRAGVSAGCDIILIETMSDLREAKAAVLAACENSDLPVFATMTFDEDGRTFLGTSPAIAAATLSSMGVAAVGLNCSLGPGELICAAKEMARFAKCPLIVKPNAGLPHIIDDETAYDMSAGEFVQAMQPIIEAGASIVGGCCGTTPAFIEKLSARVLGETPRMRAFEEAFVVTGAQKATVLPKGGREIAIIGERINPTGKDKLKEALRSGNYDYIVGEAVSQVQAGADILDVNVGLPEIDEPRVLRDVVASLQEVTNIPLQIDSSDVVAIEAAVREYAGKPLINSVNGKRESLESILPVAKCYGCAVVGLTLDEDGIPPTAEGRFAIAERIVETAQVAGIPRCDIAIDCLVMTVATNQDEIPEILRAVTMVKERLGVKTILGVSNVSFGMPARSLINATFLAAALGAGLDMPILNPLSQRYRDVVSSFRVLNGQDVGGVAFIEEYANAEEEALGASPAVSPNVSAPSGANPNVSAPSGANPKSNNAPCSVPVTETFADATDSVEELVSFIISGRSASVPAATEALLVNHDPLAVVNEIFVPVLDAVGEKYDCGEFFLPQLMASAEAVKAGFDVVRARVRADQKEHGDASDDAQTNASRTIVVATVEGDIHDIGKNIVKMLLENYGFPVIDLGRDVSPERVVEATRESGAKLVGLSALMTTTVKAMERTIELLRKELPDVAIMVGGAVLTPSYAEQIHATFYAKDAAESARIASGYFDSIDELSETS